MKWIADRKVYDTAKATLLASDRYFDGSNFDRHGRNTYLYRTNKGHYFLHTTSQWQGEFDEIIPIEEAAAVDMFTGPLRDQEMGFEEAFPSVQLEEA